MALSCLPVIVRDQDGNGPFVWRTSSSWRLPSAGHAALTSGLPSTATVSDSSEGHRWAVDASVPLRSIPGIFPCIAFISQVWKSYDRMYSAQWQLQLPTMGFHFLQLTRQNMSDSLHTCIWVSVCVCFCDNKHLHARLNVSNCRRIMNVYQKPDMNLEQRRVLCFVTLIKQFAKGEKKNKIK